jgi:hypothetical protein
MTTSKASSLRQRDRAIIIRSCAGIPRNGSIAVPGTGSSPYAYVSVRGDPAGRVAPDGRPGTR